MVLLAETPGPGFCRRIMSAISGTIALLFRGHSDEEFSAVRARSGKSVTLRIQNQVDELPAGMVPRRPGSPPNDVRNTWVPVPAAGVGTKTNGAAPFHFGDSGATLGHSNIDRSRDRL